MRLTHISRETYANYMMVTTVGTLAEDDLSWLYGALSSYLS